MRGKFEHWGGCKEKTEGQKDTKADIQIYRKTQVKKDRKEKKLMLRQTERWNVSLFTTGMQKEQQEQEQTQEQMKVNI
jgi:hypothetical protein